MNTGVTTSRLVCLLRSTAVTVWSVPVVGELLVVPRRLRDPGAGVPLWPSAEEEDRGRVRRLSVLPRRGCSTYYVAFVVIRVIM